MHESKIEIIKAGVEGRLYFLATTLSSGRVLIWESQAKTKFACVPVVRWLWPAGIGLSLYLVLSPGRPDSISNS